MTGRGVAAGLALHLPLAGQPAVGRHLGRHVAGGVHADVDVLARARLLARQQRDEQRHHGPVAGGVERLVAAAAHRRQRVVVVAAAPHRAGLGQQREVGDRLARRVPTRRRTA